MDWTKIFITVLFMRNVMLVSSVAPNSWMNGPWDASVSAPPLSRANNLWPGSGKYQPLPKTPFIANFIVTSKPSTSPDREQSTNEELTSVIRNRGPTYSTKGWLVMNGDQCTNEVIRVRGNGVSASFDLPCLANGKTRYYVNVRGNKVLVGKPNEDFCAFSDKEKTLVVIEHGICTTRTYSDTGAQVGEEQMKDAICETVKARIQSSKSGFTNVGPSQPSVRPPSKQKVRQQQQYTGDVLHSGENVKNVYENGPTYKVVINKNIDNEGSCMERITISMASGHGIQDTFIVPCLRAGTRSITNKKDVVVVGHPEEDFCIFSDTTYSLAVMEREKCSERHYNEDGAMTNEETIIESFCKEVKKKLKELLTMYGSHGPSNGNSPSEFSSPSHDVYNEQTSISNSDSYEVNPKEISQESNSYVWNSGANGWDSEEHSSGSSSEDDSSFGNEDASDWDSGEFSSGLSSEDDSSFGDEGSNAWNFGTSHSFNNHGGANQVYTGAVINSGFNNFGNKYISSSGTTTITSGATTMTFTGNDNQGITFGDNFGSWQTIWDGSVYNVKTKRKQDDNKKCREDMWIIGREDKLEKYFDLECLASGKSRNVNNAGQVLIIGEQRGDFCAFTSKRNELYYKQKGKWKKCTFKNGNIQEQGLKSNELAKVKERITKWEGLFERNRKEIERIGQMQGDAGIKHGKKMRKIGDMQRAEGDETIRKNDEIRTLWEQEAKRQKDDQRKLNDKGRSTGWGSAYHRLLEEQQSRMNREQDRINQIQNDENERYNRENEKYTRMMEEERIKYEEECTKFEKLKEQEAIRFDKQLKQFINNGW